MVGGLSIFGPTTVTFFCGEKSRRTAGLEAERADQHQRQQTQHVDDQAETDSDEEVVWKAASAHRYFMIFCGKNWPRKDEFSSGPQLASLVRSVPRGLSDKPTGCVESRNSIYKVNVATAKILPLGPNCVSYLGRMNLRLPAILGFTLGVHGCFWTLAAIISATSGGPTSGWKILEQNGQQLTF